jgi:hypothetical protein
VLKQREDLELRILEKGKVEGSSFQRKHSNSISYFLSRTEAQDKNQRDSLNALKKTLLTQDKNQKDSLKALEMTLTRQNLQRSYKKFPLKKRLKDLTMG